RLAGIPEERRAIGAVEKCRRLAFEDLAANAARLDVAAGEAFVGPVAAGAGDCAVGGEDWIEEKLAAQCDAGFGERIVLGHVAGWKTEGNGVERYAGGQRVPWDRIGGESHEADKHRESEDQIAMRHQIRSRT